MAMGFDAAEATAALRHSAAAGGVEMAMGILLGEVAAPPLGSQSADSSRTVAPTHHLPPVLSRLGSSGE